jgi:hypothetical protein
MIIGEIKWFHPLNETEQRPKGAHPNEVRVREGYSRPMSVAPPMDVRFTLDSDQTGDIAPCPFSADIVAKVFLG